MSFPPRPYLPFPDSLEPVPAQNSGPYCLEIDGKWIPYLLGAVSALAQDQTWTTDIARATGEARNLLGILADALPCALPGPDGLEGDCDMGCCLRWSDTGKLQQFTCGQWVDVPGPQGASTSNGAQPAAGTPIPDPGGCEEFIGNVKWGGRWLLPVPVSTGDTLRVTGLEGATTDYALTQLLWRCGDGTIFLGGACIAGSEILDSLAPDPTSPQQCLLAFDGVNYYDCSAAANGGAVDILIPTGIVNANLVFLINDEVTFGAGDLSWDVRYCKKSNTVARFTHTFDFRSGLHGWTIRTVSAVAPLASYVPGAGIQVTNPSGVAGQGLLEIGRDMPRTLQNVTVEFLATTVHPNANEHGIYNMPTPLVFTDAPLEAFADATNPNLDQIQALSMDCDALKLNANADNPGETSTITSCVITADGDDPF